MTADEFSDLIRTIEGYWPTKVFEAHTMDVWWQQMQAWRCDLVMGALPQMARDFQWCPSFSQLAEGYRIQVTMADVEREKRRRHLHVARDPELVARWTRVITEQLRGGAIGGTPGMGHALGLGEPDDRPIARAIRRHYRFDGGPTVGLIVLDGAKMLEDAEEALADDAFGGS